VPNASRTPTTNCLPSHAYCTTTFCSTRSEIRVLVGISEKIGRPCSSTGASYSAFISISSRHCSIDSRYLRRTLISSANSEICEMHSDFSW
jgi:hypothetical protein